ncbi:MAG: hypothetical protein ABJA82_03290 [Myxococcales bacterium]
MTKKSIRWTGLRTLIPLVVVALAPACALKPPARNAGPSISREGVQMAVVNQRCGQFSDPDQTEDLAEVIVEVQIHNPTREPAIVRRSDFRLIGDERYALKALTWHAIDPITVAPGSDGMFELRFMARGAVECAKEMRLDPQGGIVTNNQPLKLDPVSFVPWRA